MSKGSGKNSDGTDGVGPPLPGQDDVLQGQFEQQQLLIEELKKMVKKSDSATVTQEKVNEYGNALHKLNERAKQSVRRKESGSDRQDTSSGRKIDVHASVRSEKTNLLRQQLEQNR